MTDLRSLWDFGDPDASERRFRDALLEDESDGGRAEILTQLARVEGLRRRFDEAERLLEEAESLAPEDAPAARVRIDLERGRVRHSSGDAEAALPLFESAYELAAATDELFLAGDAAHMAALAAPDHEQAIRWTERGIELAERAEPARYWLGPLLNNIGWAEYERGNYDDALASFERALAVREHDPQNAEAIALGRYAVSKALRALGRPSEAVPLAEQAVEWSRSAGNPDGWFHEELAEVYAAVGRYAEAATYAEQALTLFRRADPLFDDESERALGLRKLAAGGRARGT